MKLIQPVAIFFILQFVFLQEAQAKSVDKDLLLLEADTICRNVRAMRLKDFDKASDEFSVFEQDLKVELYKIEPNFTNTQGLNASSVQRLCTRVSESMSRERALKILDSALLSCEKASDLRKRGELSQANIEHSQYLSMIDQVRKISPEAIDLHPSALQFQHCSNIGSSINQRIDKRANDIISTVEKQSNICVTADATVRKGTWEKDLDSLTTYLNNLISDSNKVIEESNNKENVLKANQQSYLNSLKSKLKRCNTAVSALVDELDKSPFKRQGQKMWSLCNEAEVLLQQNETANTTQSRFLYNQLNESKETLSEMAKETNGIKPIYVAKWISNRQEFFNSCEAKLQNSYNSKWDLPETEIEFDLNPSEVKDLDEFIEDIDKTL